LARLALAALLAFAAGCEHAEPPLAPLTFSSDAWPNEPVGLTVLSEYGFDETLPTGVAVPLSDGWRINNPAGYATQASDPGAPLSPPNVGQWRYPIGFAGGDAPATMYYQLDSPHEMYFSYSWKASTPWQGHPSGVNEISFVVAQDNILVVQMHGPPGGEGPYALIVTTEFTTSNGHLENSEGDDPGTRHLFGNVNGGNYIVTPGQWYQIEVYFKMSTTSASRDGVIRWWVNGTLVGDYTTVNFDVTHPWEEFQFSPNWGGVGSAKTEEDHFWYDHVRLSVGTSPAPGDLMVTTNTSGLSLDPDGYTITVDGSQSQAIAVNDSVAFTGLAPGDHVVTLSNVAGNCTARDGPTRTVTVPSGGTASTAFSVRCEPGPATQLVFTVQPSNALPYPAATIQPPVKVSVLDAQGNTVMTFAGQVTIAIGRNGGVLVPGTLRGTQSVAAVNGVATFPDLSIDQPGRGYTLRTAALDLAGTESASFDILMTR
jgi:hypothetical protein